MAIEVNRRDQRCQACSGGPSRALRMTRRDVVAASRRNWHARRVRSLDLDRQAGRDFAINIPGSFAKLAQRQ